MNAYVPARLERFEQGQAVVFSDEVAQRHRDGHSVWTEVNARYLRNSATGRIESIGVSRDITERKRAAEIIKESQEYLANIIAAIADPVFVKDENSCFTVANKAMCALLGKTADEVIGTTGAELHPAEEMAHFLSVDREVLSSGVENTCEEPITSADGATRTIVTKKTRYVDRKGKKFIVGVIRDTTEMKQMQAQIAQSDRLASMGMLAAGVAHEINNPLCYILYNLESLADDFPRFSLALRECLDAIISRIGIDDWAALAGTNHELLNPVALDDMRARCKDALQGTHQIKDIVRGLGMFSRVDEDRLVAVNLMHVIEGAINLVSNEIKYRCRIVKDYGKLSTVMANDGRLSQVFLNLLVNAAHAIGEGDVEGNEIRVRTWQEGDEILAEEQDTGKGIAAEHLPRLFEPFFTTKEVGVGTGLGLSISKSIIEGYGGRIEVTSDLGKGTRFVVRLPVTIPEETTETAPARAADAGERVCGRVLIIDDEPAIRASMKRMMREHEVVEASSGAEGQKTLEIDQAFDLILCDMMMPEMSGVELHEWLIQAHPKLATQVVFITGGAFTPKAREHLGKVSNIRFEKPFDVVNFKKIVSELIVAYRARGA